MSRRFYIKFSGAAFTMNSTANAEEAWKQIRDHLWCYCSYQAMEIGVDCDELGYPILRNSEADQNPVS